MADVTGPISSLPGTAHNLPTGTTCDQHPDRPAVTRIQGETDSFGSELIDCCEVCRDEILAAIRDDSSGCCDWCKKEADDLRDTRDEEEGMCGPVYHVCESCRQRREERLLRELDMHGDWDWS